MSITDSRSSGGPAFSLHLQGQQGRAVSPTTILAQSTTSLMIAPNQRPHAPHMTTPAIDFLWTGPTAATTTLLLAHGAGAPMDTPFMTYFADSLAATGMRVGRFEFPYMAERRRTGVRKPPNTTTVLLDTWRAAVAHCGAARPIIGGKSMGGRMASMVADELKVAGLLCLGYPFYGAGRKDQPRIAHLEHLAARTLICQGERDAMGDRDAVSTLKLSKHISLHWCMDGDHDLKPRKASGRTHAQNLDGAREAIVGFVAALQHQKAA
jgi:uncharacterized protein